ncbi:unnamed protein product [marine sediment metagenome]|uniref:DUF371 domain-containing protein n=1 Tax=marine sediment metagenome TaxID=412755 RepID=X1EVB3_9ZZZZ
MIILDSINAIGHPLIQCTHSTTIELTKDDYLTKKGTCILGIKASKSCYDLNSVLKKKVKNGEKIDVVIKIDDITDSFYGYGNKNLTLLSKKDLVFRKSNYICDRTILINCTKSSRELNRNIISKLTNSKKQISILFKVNDTYE